MSIDSKLRKIYLAVPIVLGLSACSVTKEITENMIFVNGPKDMKYKTNTYEMTAEQDIRAKTILREQRETNTVDKHYFDIKLIPYQQSATNTTPYMLNYSIPPIPKK